MMLYIHLPFCKSKCAYCAFCSGKYPKSLQRRYVDRLVAMMEHFLKDKKVSTVYIGGGTPSVLPLPLWQKLLEAIARHVNFSVLEEFTVELNPESTTDQLLKLLKEYGVNRLSFGVQSLCDKELKIIGRLHTAAQALEALHLAQRNGFDNIGVDLIYGLPEQSVESFRQSLARLLSYNITHLSCYNLQLEEGTALFEKQSALSFPDEDAQLLMYETLVSMTAAAGMEHYEISNFAKIGKKAIHNSGYWTGRDYLGLGVAAHSKIGDKRYCFTDDIDAFLNKEDFSFDETVSLSPQDIKEERIMLGLRTDRGVPMNEIDQSKARHYISLGVAGEKDGCFVLNSRGYLISNTIISDLM